MGVSCGRHAIPLCDRLGDHSSVPIIVCKAEACGGGPRRPNGRREAALRWTGASTASLVRPGMRVWAVVPLLLILTASHSVGQSVNGSTAVRAVSQTSNPFAAFVYEASKRFAVPANLISSVISIESVGDVHAKSPKGAIGLMQIMPATWAELRERYHLGSDPYDPRNNILAGTAYLRELLDRYGSPGAFAAYNAGPTCYDGHLAGGPLSDETRVYVAKLANLLGIELPATRTASQRPSAAATLFVGRTDLVKAGDRKPTFLSSSGATTAISSRDVSQMVPKATDVFVARSNSGAGR
ncbi:Soluble lytic murein transglycosylase [Bradyrhizobium ivorense]|nr:Soluble lytic murein transglycosylase [Bradyrhizobium ivorense]